MSRSSWLRCFAFSFIIPALLFTNGAARVFAQDIPAEAYITGVYGYAQTYNLSGESRSASDWAAFFGVNASEYDILASLPRTDNPETGFVGSPSGGWGSIPPYSYGVHPPPIAQSLRSFGLNAQERQGMSWDELRLQIAADRPVIVWIIGQMWSGTPIAYTASDGQTTTVAYFEHTMIVTGYSPSVVYVVDSYSGQDQIYDINAFLVSWAVLGNRAVVLEGEPPAPQPDEQQSAGDEPYIVERGETLSGLADRFNLPWQELADYNQIPYPYLLYVGQTLHLPNRTNDAESGPTATPEPLPTPLPTPAPVDQPGFHTVRAGETLLGIANEFGVSWEEIATGNRLTYPYFIYPGQLLQVNQDTAQVTPTPTATPEPTPTVEPSATAQPTARTYIVQPGDTLAKIGREFGIDWPVLAEYNGIVYPYRLYAGQTLNIP